MIETHRFRVRRRNLLLMNHICFCRLPLAVCSNQVPAISGRVEIYGFVKSACFSLVASAVQHSACRRHDVQRLAGGPNVAISKKKTNMSPCFSLLYEKQLCACVG